MVFSVPLQTVPRRLHDGPLLVILITQVYRHDFCIFFVFSKYLTMRLALQNPPILEVPNAIGLQWEGGETRGAAAAEALESSAHH